MKGSSNGGPRLVKKYSLEQKRLFNDAPNDSGWMAINSGKTCA